MIFRLFKPKTPKQLIISLRISAAVSCLTTVLLVAALVIKYKMKNVETENDILRPARVAVFGDTMLFDGDIGTRSVDKVRSYIDGDKDKEIQTFYIQKSNGGTAIAADALVKILNERNITVVFPYDSECISSCVLLLIRAKSREVQPASGFGFHQGWRREEDWSIKGVYHLLADGNWPKKAYYMDDWAREISPDFLAFLEGCSSKPLRNENALVIPWSVISRVANHTFPLTCDQGRKPPP